MFESGVEAEVRHALVEAQPSTTARKILGLDEVAKLPRDEAVEAIITRTRRYAAYQRKWLRRLEGLAMVAADRPPEETAAEIVALARTRERLPRP
jgi:tRNA A37 N6-isopentenylltransferase MiaA